MPNDTLGSWIRTIGFGVLAIASVFGTERFAVVIGCKTSLEFVFVGFIAGIGLVFLAGFLDRFERRFGSRSGVATTDPRSDS